MIHSVQRLEITRNHPLNPIEYPSIDCSAWMKSSLVRQRIFFLHHQLKVHNCHLILVCVVNLIFVIVPKNIMAMNASDLSKDLRICDDYLQFQNHLKDLRKVDDLIINTLNTTVLTATFRSQGSDASKQCQQLGDQVFHSIIVRSSIRI